MDVSGSYTLYVPRSRVWEALLDPTVLRRVVPGCETLERAEDGSFRGSVRIGIAAVKGEYHGTLRLVDPRPPEACTIVADGTGARGIIHGESTIHLAAVDENTTVVTYTGKAQLGGPIASVGARVVGAASTVLIRSMFAALADALGEPAPESRAVGGAAAPGKGAQANTASSAASGTAASAEGTATTAISSGATREDMSSAGLSDADAAPRRAVGTAPVGSLPKQTPTTRLVRRLGLSDGSRESERRWSRGMVAAGLVMALAAAALTGSIVLRLMHR